MKKKIFLIVFLVNVLIVLALSDTTPPAIDILSPVNDSILITNYVWLNATTNEEAVCYYSLWNCEDVGGGALCEETPPEVMNAETIKTTFEEDVWRVETLYKKFEMSNSQGWASGNETIRDIMTSIDEDELDVLSDGSVTTEKGTAGYNQYINFEDRGREGGYVKFLENDEDIASDFIYFKSGSQIARYSLEFKTSLQSDVEDSAGTKTTTGTYLGDFYNKHITILGRDYSIVRARRVSSTGNSIELTLMTGEVEDVLNEGETKTYTIDGKDYEVNVIGITNIGVIYVTFNVNGELTIPLMGGEFATLSDGTKIGVKRIVPNLGAGTTPDYVEFYLGADQVYLKDTRISDTMSSNWLQYNGELIDDAYVIITGTDDNSTFSIDTIQLNITADDDYYIPPGGNLSYLMDEPQALLESWDIKYDGLDPSVDLETYKIKTAGYNQYNLEFTDGSGNQATIPIAYSGVASTISRFGDYNDDLILSGRQVINKNDYFVVSDYSQDDGQRKTYALRYKGADKVASGQTAIVKFDNLGTGTRIELTYIQTSGDTPSSTLKLGGATFGIINASADTVDDFDIQVDLDGDGTITSDADVIAINTNAGLKIVITNRTNYVVLDFSTPNSNHYDNIVPATASVNVTADSNTKVQFSASVESTIAWVSPSAEPTNIYAYTSMGAKFKWENPLNDPDLLTINYPKQQRLPLVYITGRGREIIEEQSHTALIEGLEETEEDSWYEAHVNCTDNYENSNEKKVTFNVDLPIGKTQPNWNLVISAINQLEPVTIGVHENATDSYDADFDSYVATPQQDKVIMTLDPIYSTDIKYPNETVIWNLDVGVPSGQTTNISWDISSVPSIINLTLSGESVILTSMESAGGGGGGGGGGGYRIDMRKINYLELDNGSHSITITASLRDIIEFNLNINAGWNMISLPLIPENNSVDAVFGDCIPTLDTWPIVGWQYPLFVSVTEFDEKIGYWLFSLEPKECNISGSPIENTTLALAAGWNMVGTTSDTNNLNISSIPNQIEIRPAVTWQYPIFVETEIIEPGKSAWVFVLQDTEVEI